MLLVAAAAILRAVPWFANYPLHRDEALYGYWARLIASGRDPFLLTPWIDKPPLVLYLLAGSLRTFGISEWALRLPGMVASTLTVAAVYGFARSAYGSRTALLAAAIAAASPFAILFAPTAFADPWLTLWLVLAAWAALARRSFLAGLALGLAVASKQQGVLGVPLVLALLVQGSVSRGAGKQRSRGEPLLLRSLAPPLLRATLGFALVLGPVTYWDSLRWANRPSFWDRSLTTYGGLYLAPLAQWPSRAMEWAGQLGYLFGAPALSAAALLLASAMGVRGLRRTIRGRPEDRASHAVDAILALYGAGYLALHVVVTFQPWDRYLLPLAPLVCILVARGLVSVRDGLNLRSFPQIKTLSILGLAGALACAAWLGAAGRLPVGSDHGAYSGLDQVVAVLRSQPANAVIYHRWLSWHYDFYLFDAPQERRWWDSGWKLAEDAARTGRVEPERLQWVALPGWEAEAASELRSALASHELALMEMERIRRPDGSLSFTLYRIVPRLAALAP
jgi:4-amino-4-deoxy-L-arabinose transferase-like glycosyltransferase